MLAERCSPLLSLRALLDVIPVGIPAGQEALLAAIWPRCGIACASAPQNGPHPLAPSLPCSRQCSARTGFQSTAVGSISLSCRRMTCRSVGSQWQRRQCHVFTQLVSALTRLAGERSHDFHQCCFARPHLLRQLWQDTSAACHCVCSTRVLACGLPRPARASLAWRCVIRMRHFRT